jgi:predicted acylesterase/phospholipase RssA
MIILLAYGVLIGLSMLTLVAILVAAYVLERRWGVRLAIRIVTPIAVIMAVTAALASWFVTWRPDFDQSRSRNTLIGRTLDRPESGSVADRLTARLGDRDTLFVLSLSGGGSRAAYFSAAILEQLQHVAVPDPSGGSVPLVSRVDVISTVSGGSVAGAYFSANAPVGAATTQQWSEFFARFKSAMAHNFEADVAREMMWPTKAPLFLLGLRNGAESLADDFDRRLFAGKKLTFKTLIDREKQGAPILLVNATDVRRFYPVSFTPLAPTATFSTPSVHSFQSYADLNPFPVADAVAASAAFPGLGWIRVWYPWEPGREGIYFSDGGLVDNSGLLSLYAHVYDRRLFEQTKGRLKRIVVISIDASSASLEFTNIFQLLMGVYERGQNQVQRFILPDMLRSTTEQEMEDLLARPEWGGFAFLDPAVLAYSDGWCRGGSQIPTRFRLRADEVEALDRGAKECVSSAVPRLTMLMDGTAARMPRYQGVFGPADKDAWHRLFDLVQEEYAWLQSNKRWAAIEELKIAADLSEATGVRYSSSIDGDVLRLYATPVSYRETGWVSLVVVLPRSELEQRGATPEARKRESINACLQFARRFHGGDLRGRPATEDDPIFLHNEISSWKRCT